MEEYLLSRLGAKARVTKHSRKIITKTLKKSFATTDKERLIVVMEFWIPDSFATRKFNPDVKAEIIAKLIRELKAGPLEHCTNDEQYFREGAVYLCSGKGKTWMADWFLPQRPVQVVRTHSRRSSPTGTSSSAKLAIAPPSRVRTPSIGAGSTKLAGPPLSSRSPRSPRDLSPLPTSTRNKTPSLSVPSSSPSAASPTTLAPSSSASMSDAPTIVCTPSIDVGGVVPPANEAAVFEEVYGPNEDALCTSCWTMHSTKMGGPFIYMPKESPSILDGMTRDDRRDGNGWRKYLSAKKIVQGTLAVGGTLAAGALAFLLKDVKSQTPGK